MFLLRIFIISFIENKLCIIWFLLQIVLILSMNTLQIITIRCKKFAARVLTLKISTRFFIRQKKKAKQEHYKIIFFYFDNGLLTSHPDCTCHIYSLTRSLWSRPERIYAYKEVIFITPVFQKKHMINSLFIAKLKFYCF